MTPGSESAPRTCLLYSTPTNSISVYHCLTRRVYKKDTCLHLELRLSRKRTLINTNESSDPPYKGELRPSHAAITAIGTSRRCISVAHECLASCSRTAGMPRSLKSSPPRRDRVRVQRLAKLVAGQILAAAILRTRDKPILELTLARGPQHVDDLGGHRKGPLRLLGLRRPGQHLALDDDTVLPNRHGPGAQVDSRPLQTRNLTPAQSIQGERPQVPIPAFMVEDANI